ncbi:large conductance mechanosensitive channel protein MscL [Candidatus Bipolaricaulota bacterium]|nr:large conductance mechanosensitive channel protein MscL [Candidatus Bipolaricaulota bacterium]
MLKGFKEFITRGNLPQIAVAFLIGMAFAALVSSFINDLIMPIIGKLIGNVDFANLFINMSGGVYESAAAAREAGAAAIYYGAFINSIVNFLIIALVAYLILRSVQRMQKPDEPAPASTKSCPFCKTSIPVDAVRCPHCTSEL